MTSDYFFYIFYSIIQGVTEFIPISSSGHLNLLELCMVKPIQEIICMKPQLIFLHYWRS